MQRASAFLSIDRNATGNILATSVTLNCNSFWVSPKTQLQAYSLKHTIS